MSKHWRRILFSLIYPVLVVLAMALFAAIRESVEKHPVFYGLCVFGIAVIVILLMVVEFIKRKWKHQLQGAKLRIREKEGIRIGEGEA